MIITGTLLTNGFNFRSQQAAPNAPTIGTVTVLSNTSANVRFTAPVGAFYSPIIGYTAIAYPGNITKEVLDPNASNITITGLADNTYYTFSVTANNSDAPSVNSASSSAVLTNSYPPAPAIGYAEYTSNTTANIVYTAPAYNGNSAITSYTAVSNVGNITATVLPYTTVPNVIINVFDQAALGASQSYSTSTMDGTGNLYVLSHNKSGVVTTKFDSNLNIVWQKSIGGTSTVPAGIAVDSTGNVCMGYGGGFTVGNGSSLAKYDSNGNRFWTYKYDRFSIKDLKFDNTGNIYAIGDSDSGEASGTNANPTFAKIDNSGSVLWLKKVGSTSVWGTTNRSAFVDNYSNLFVAGQRTTNSNRVLDAQMLKISTNLNATQIGNSIVGDQNSVGNDESFTSVAVDNAGNVIAVGYTNNGSVGQDKWLLTKFVPTENGGTTAGFGNWVSWIKYSNASIYGKAINVVAEPNTSNVYIIGYIQNKETALPYRYVLQIYKCDTDGNFIYARRIRRTDNSDDTNGMGISVYNGNLYITGDTNGAVRSGTGDNILIAKVPTDGTGTGTYVANNVSYTYETGNILLSTGGGVIATPGTLPPANTTTITTSSPGTATRNTSNVVYSSFNMPAFGNISVNGLSNNITYGFTVYATNEYGRGLSSNISNGIFLSPVIFTPPDAPTIVYAQARDGISANIVYTAPISSGNSIITSYTARSTPGNVTATVITATSGNISIGGLTRNTTYTFTVTANNAIGTSANSAISNSITTLTVPNAPIMATWEASDGAANIGYTAPSFNGNSPIISYTLTTVPENRTVTRQGAGSGNISITGLDYNTTYVFAVYATNLVGSSILSSFSGYLTPTVVTDPFFKYVTLLISANGTNNANNNVFVDSSTNNFAITRNGESTSGTFAPYGTKWGNYFNGSSYMVPDSAINTAMGTGFVGNIISFEMWIYPTNFDAGSYGQAITAAYAAVAANGRWIISLEKTAATTSKINFSYTTGTGTQNDCTSTASAITRNQWNHVAVTVDATTSSSATIKLFVNGSLLNTFTSQNMSTQTAYYRAPYIGGANSQFVSEFYGYISDFRILKGSLAYTGNYTVPTAPLTAITNTVLLTCQSYGFKDNSANNYALTLAGTPAVYKFSPYASDKSYPADVYGGSAYFDGSGDYLSLPTNQTPLALSNSDWTVEAWVYRTSSSTGTIFCGQGDNSTAAGSAYVFYVSSSATSDVYGTSFSGGGVSITSPNPTLSAWAHVAWVRTGGTYSSYLNGVRVGTASTLSTNSINAGSAANPPCIGSLTNGNALQGYISNLRLIKGSGGYDATQSTIQIPTAPVTAITNTSLLCNFTNIGVYDGSMNTNLRTVGDAKISTAQYKFGLSSMAFDGTGDFVTVRGNQQALYSMGTADFTIEMWIYTLSVNGHLIDTNNGGDASGSGRFAIQINSNQLQAYNSTGTTMIIGGTINTNQWYHIAYARASGLSKLFVDGEQVGSTYTDTNNFVCGNANRPVFGVNGYDEASTPMNGYIDDLRITRGYARYTTTGFAPPQRAFETK